MRTQVIMYGRNSLLKEMPVQHSDDLGVSCHLRSKEDDRDEYEQCTEEIGKVGDEVEIIIKHNSMQRGMVLRKLCQILIDIKDNGDADDQRNGKDISTDKLLDDVPVYSLNVTEWIDKSQKLQFPSNPLAYALQ